MEERQMNHLTDSGSRFETVVTYLCLFVLGVVASRNATGLEFWIVVGVELLFLVTKAWKWIYASGNENEHT